MLFYEIIMSQATIFMLYAVYKKHEMKKKLAIKTEKNRKFSNSFALDYMSFTSPDWVFPIEMGGVSVFVSMKKNSVLSK